MLVDILPGHSARSITDLGSSPAPSQNQLDALIQKGPLTDGIGGWQEYTFTGNGYTANLCAGGTATASNHYGSAGPENAFDGDAGTVWWSTISGAAWIKYQFAAAKKICKVRVYQANYFNGAIKDFTVDGSNDGGSWATLYTGQAANQSGWQNFTFTNDTAYLYVRLNISNKWSGDYYIQEIEMMEAALSSLQAKVDITGGGTVPVSEVRYITGYSWAGPTTDPAEVVIKVSADNSNWTTLTMAAAPGLTNVLRGAVAADIRYIWINHSAPSAGSVTVSGIHAYTQRLACAARGQYQIMQPATHDMRAWYGIGGAGALVVEAMSKYGICQPTAIDLRAAYAFVGPSRRDVAGRYHIAQSTRRDTRGGYHVAGPEIAIFAPALADALERLFLGILKTGKISPEFQIEIWNLKNPSVKNLPNLDRPTYSDAWWGRSVNGYELSPVTILCLQAVNLRITLSLEDGGYDGGGLDAGLEFMAQKWFEARSAGVLGPGPNSSIGLINPVPDGNGGWVDSATRELPPEWLAAFAAQNFGAVDDAQAEFTPIGGAPDSGGLAVGKLPPMSGRTITCRVVVPQDAATPFASRPKLLIEYDAAPWPGHGDAFGLSFGG